MSDSYRNPFSGVNAVQLKEDAILDYWCSPFTYNIFSEIKQSDIYREENNIVLMGGRSTGKSMFLRYWSYPIQFRRAEKERKKPLDIIKGNEGIGFYFRIDSPILKSFDGYDLNTEHWASLFTHYFELTVGIQYLEALKRLQEDAEISEEAETSCFVPKVCELLRLSPQQRLEPVITELDRRLRFIDTYRGDVTFHKKAFEPDGPVFPSESLSFGIANLIIQCFDSFRDLNIIILLDEYENFLTYQQMMVNALLRFTKPQIKFRIGMRLEGFRTYNMMGTEDFIKEGREYRKVVFEDISSQNSDYPKFLAEIAKKRLEHVRTLREAGFVDIKKFLSVREDLEQEARDLVKNDPNRVFNQFLKSSGVPKKELEKVRCLDNPLIELLNMIWLMRGVSADETRQAMRDFLDGRKTKGAKKYRLDYVDKYKLSLMFLLCSIYRKEKQYYSFNTFSFLSSGIVGQFIELCRRSFANAEWRDRDALLENGTISREDQTRAARDCSVAEKQQISRIEDYGGTISRFIEKIGNIFRAFHADHKLRYPEVNQFATNIEALSDKNLQYAMQAAIKWSVIQKKRTMHRSGPGEPLQDIYAVNRIFSPSFQISYRTRGGKSVALNEKQLEDLMSDKALVISNYTPKDGILKDSASGKLFPEQ
jgi:hypothetical protein